MKTHLPGHSSKKSAEQKEGPMIPLAAFIIFVSFLNSRAIPQNSLMQHHSFCHRVRWFLTKPVPFSGVACAVPQTRLCGSTRAEIRAERGREKKIPRWEQKTAAERAEEAAILVGRSFTFENELTRSRCLGEDKNEILFLLQIESWRAEKRVSHARGALQVFSFPFGFCKKRESELSQEVVCRRRGRLSRSERTTPH